MDAMADVLEQVRICRCRIRRRRWLCLGVAWAVCASGWTALLAVVPGPGAGPTSALLTAVFLAGTAAGALAAAVAAARAPVFDTAAELQRWSRAPVLGSIASMTDGSRAQSIPDLCFIIAGGGLVGTFAALLALQVAGLSG